MTRLRYPLTALALAASLTLGACGGSSSDSAGDAGDKATTTEAEGGDASTTAAEGGGGGTEVDIVDFAYDPGTIEVSAGDTVTFKNSDSAAHTATSDADAPTEFDTGDIDGDGTAEVTFDEAGEYKYYCSIHEYMTGTVEVK